MAVKTNICLIHKWIFLTFGFLPTKLCGIKMNMISVGQLQFCVATRARARTREGWREEGSYQVLLLSQALKNYNLTIGKAEAELVTSFVGPNTKKECRVPYSNIKN